MSEMAAAAPESAEPATDPQQLGTAIGLIYPELAGRLDGHAVRVPLLNASIIDCVFEDLTQFGLRVEGTLAGGVGRLIVEEGMVERGVARNLEPDEGGLEIGVCMSRCAESVYRCVTRFAGLVACGDEECARTGLHEPPRFASLSLECLASAEHHGRL